MRKLFQNNNKSTGIKTVPRRVNVERFQRVKGDYLLAKPNSKEIDEIARLTQGFLHPKAKAKAVERLVAHNSNVLRCIKKTAEAEINSPIDAFLAMLPLSEEGYQAFLNGGIDLINPPCEFIVTEGKTPEALYIWGFYAQRSFVKALSLIEDLITQGQYENCPKYARPINSNIRQTLQRLGWFPCNMNASLYNRGIFCHPSMKRKHLWL